MYLSRGNPVVYYGDEQGFTGPGGDQSARQTMFASNVEEYQNDDQIGTDRTAAQDNFVTDHPLYADIAQLATLTARFPALRDGAEQVRHASEGPGVFAMSRLARGRGHELVVALNNSESEASAAVPTYVRGGRFRRVYGDGAARLRTDRDRRLHVTVPALSTVVYESVRAVPRSAAAPVIRLRQPHVSPVSHGRMEVSARVRGSSFYEVTFQRRVGDGRWRTVGVDDNAPYRVFDDTTAGLEPGDRVSYRAAVLDNAGHTRGTPAQTVRVPGDAVRITAPADGGDVSDLDPVTVTASVDPERPLQVVEVQRQVGSGPWTTLHVDSSAPVYTAQDDVSDLDRGTTVRYRAVLREPGARPVRSTPVEVTVAAPKPAVRSVTVAGSLQTELGCGADWDPACAATHLAFDTADGLWHGTFTLPPSGDGNAYEWKVAIDDSWTVNYGTGGAAGGGNLTLPAAGGTFRFTWNQVTHVPSAVPAG
jgi:hypothetical protein